MPGQAGLALSHFGMASASHHQLSPGRSSGAQSGRGAPSANPAHKPPAMPQHDSTGTSQRSPRGTAFMSELPPSQGYSDPSLDPNSKCAARPLSQSPMLPASQNPARHNPSPARHVQTGNPASSLYPGMAQFPGSHDNAATQQGAMLSPRFPTPHNNPATNQQQQQQRRQAYDGPQLTPHFSPAGI